MIDQIEKSLIEKIAQKWRLIRAYRVCFSQKSDENLDDFIQAISLQSRIEVVDDFGELRRVMFLATLQLLQFLAIFLVEDRRFMQLLEEMYPLEVGKRAVAFICKAWQGKFYDAILV